MTLVNDLKSGRKTIGVFVSRLGRMWEPEFLVGITDAARTHNLNVICFVGGKPTAITAPGNLQPSYGLYDIARAEQLAGIIISGDLGYELGADEIRQFVENYSHIPMITNSLQVDGTPNLIGDNLTGMRAAVSHLLDVHGYKSVAFIRGPKDQVEAEQRLTAFKLELKARNIPYDENLVLPGDFSIESGRAAISILLDERKLKVDAILAANDRMAIGAFEALQLRGLQIPGGIALTGFDDVREARTLAVPLTTVRQSFHAMGTQAVELLMRRINGDSLPARIVSPTRFVVRRSCGCLSDSARHGVEDVETIPSGDHGKDPETLAHALFQAVNMPPESPHAAAFKLAGVHTWEALLNTLHGESPADVFLSSLEALFDVLAPYNDDTVCWDGVISVLRQHTIHDLREQEISLRAEILFQQARSLAGEHNQRLQALQRLRLEHQEEVLQDFSFSMAPAMSLDEIGSVMKRHFPEMGIDRLYVMIYASVTSPQSTTVPPSENYHLLMQYDETGFNMPADRPKWGTGRLIPRGLTPENRRYTAIVMPLTLAQNRFGFLWIEMNVREWEVYVRIRNLISSALLRTMLVDQRALMQKHVEQLLQDSQKRTLELADANEKAEKTAEDNARLYTREQQRRENAEALSKVVHKLSTLLKMEEMPQQILNQLGNLLSFERGALLIEEPDGSTRVAAERGFPENTHVDHLLVQADPCGAYAQILRSGKAVIIEDVTTCSDYEAVDWLPSNHSWLGVPLFSKSRAIGMLSLTRQAEADFSEDDLLLMTMFGIQAGISLENARLYDEVTRFNELLERMVSQRVEELNSAYYKLEKLDKNKTSFIQITAHELRTPITVMKGYLSMLKGNPAIQENSSLSQAVDGVLIGTDRLHQIVNSMLDVTRLEEQIITPQLETVVAGLVLKQVQKEYAADLAARNILFRVEHGVGDLPFVMADPQLLQKALDAIIVNAIKFTPDGGSIRVGGRTVDDDVLGPCLEIHISDTGIGIDPTNQGVIFEKLFQLGKVELHSSGRTKFKGGGPGLGLAIAASIIKAHHGRLWVESPGCDEEKFPGSTFFIRLPLSTSPNN